MASSSIYKRSYRSNMKFLLCNDSGNFGEKIPSDEASARSKVENLGVSERVLRNFSQKFKKNSKRNDLGSYLIEERERERPSSSSCLSMYIKGVSCNRVGSCEEIHVNGFRKSSISEDCLPLKGVEKKNSRMTKGLEQCPQISPPEISLPDDVLEMILVRLPLRSLIRARVVCKKWNQMIVSPRFMQCRCGWDQKSPWLFVFGLTRKGVHLGEVFAFDLAEDCWHVIRNDLLRDRFLYSVASIGMDVFIVGGCSASETHKGGCVFSPLTSSWHEINPMKVARSEPVLGVFEVGSNCSIFRNHDNMQDRNRPRLKTRNYMVSDVYEDPHRFSIRRQIRDAFNESDSSVEIRRNSSNAIGQRGSNQPKFALIVVGGVGLHDEHLDSGEIYDPINDNWIEIARLPVDFGSVSSGAVCRGKFYVHSYLSGKLAGYDLERCVWVVIQTSHPPPCLRAYHPKLVSCRDRLFMCCVCWSEGNGHGNNRVEKAVRELWELDTAAHSWSEVSRHPDAPMDKYSTFVADYKAIYGLDMFRVFGQALNFLTACHVSNDEFEWSRVTRKHAGHEACSFSFMTKSMVVLRL